MTKSVSFQAPSDFTTEQQSIDRQRALAQMLQEQGIKETPTGTEMVSGWAVKKSPLEGLNSSAKQLNAWLSENQADERQKVLATALRTRTAEDFEKYSKLKTGSEAVAPESYSSEFSPETMETSGRAAVAPNRNAALALALSSPSPALQSIGMQDYAPFTLKEGEKRYQGGDVVASSPKSTEYHEPKNVVINGKTFLVSYAKDGKSPPIVREGNLQNTFNTGTVDNAADRAFNIYKHGQPSMAELLHLGQTNQSLGRQAAETQFNTGQSVGGGVPLPSYQPMTPPFAGAPSAPQAGPGTPPVAPAAPQPAPMPQRPMPPQAPRPVAPAAPQPAALPADGQTPAGRAQTATAVATDIGKKQAEMRLALPKTIADAQMTHDTIDQLVGKQTSNPDRMARTGTEKPHPGFSNLVGAGFPGMKHVPGSDAAGAYALHNQIQGQAFLQAFEKLKGGGQITEIEGTKATQAITRMNTAQSEAEYIKAAREFQTILKQGIQRAREMSGSASGAVLRFDAQGNPIQ